MMNYKIKTNDGVWEIHETQTNQVVRVCSTATEAQVIKTSLNRGFGFSGWTPVFFLENISSLPQKH